MRRTLFCALAIAGIAFISLPRLLKPQAMEHPAPQERLYPSATAAPQPLGPPLARFETPTNQPAGTAPSPAQVPRPRSNRDSFTTRADRLSEMGILKRNLGLTDEQVRKLKPILSREEVGLSEVRRNPNLSRPDRVAQTRQVQDSTDKALAALLTPQQFEQWRHHRLPPQNPLADPLPTAEEQAAALGKQPLPGSQSTPPPGQLGRQ